MLHTTMASNNRPNTNIRSAEEVAEEEFQNFVQSIQHEQAATLQIQRKITQINDICYDTCVKDIANSNQLNSNEQQCMKSCVQRYLKSAQYIQKHFQSLMQ